MGKESVRQRGSQTGLLSAAKLICAGENQVPEVSSIRPARPDAAPFFIIIYRPFFPPGYSRMKIVVCSTSVSDAIKKR